VTTKFRFRLSVLLVCAKLARRVPATDKDFFSTDALGAVTEHETSRTALAYPSHARRLAHISRANRDRSSGGVARIIATASATPMVPPSSFMLVTAFIQAPKLSAGPSIGLY